MQQFTTFTEQADGSLLIQLTEAGKEEAKEMLEKLDSPTTKVSYEAMWWDINEYNFCNGYQDTSGKFALSTMPTITDSIVDDETTQLEIDHMKIWGFRDHVTRDELRELLEKGEVVFDLIQAYTPFPESADDIEDKYVEDYMDKQNLRNQSWEDFKEARYELWKHVNGFVEPEETAPPHKPKILITIQGGALQSIVSSTPDIDIVVTDYDSQQRIDDYDGPNKYDEEELENGDEIPDSAHVVQWEPDMICGPIHEHAFGPGKLTKAEQFVQETLKRWNF